MTDTSVPVLVAPNQWLKPSVHDMHVPSTKPWWRTSCAVCFATPPLPWLFLGTAVRRCSVLTDGWGGAELCQIEGPVFIWSGGISTIRFGSLICCYVLFYQDPADQSYQSHDGELLSLILCLMKTTVGFNAVVSWLPQSIRCEALKWESGPWK